MTRNQKVSPGSPLVAFYKQSSNQGSHTALGNVEDILITLHPGEFNAFLASPAKFNRLRFRTDRMACCIQLRETSFNSWRGPLRSRNWGGFGPCVDFKDVSRGLEFPIKLPI